MREALIAFKHKPDCTSSIVNPVVKWAGGPNVVIIGYKCPQCGDFTEVVQSDT